MSAKGMLKSINQTPPFTVLKAWILALLVTGISLFWLDIPIIINILSSFQGLDPRVQLDVCDPKYWLLIPPQIATFFLYYFIIVMYSQEPSAYRYSLIFVYVICLVLNAIIANIYVLYSTFGYLYYDFSSIYTIWDVYKQIFSAHKLSIYINIGFLIYLMFEFFISPSVKRVEKSDKEDVFGGAKEATKQDLKNHKILVPSNRNKIQPKNNYICYGKHTDSNDYIGSVRPYNTITVSKPEGGKGITSVIPFLLDCEYPIFVNDIKSELFQVVSSHRMSMFNKKPIVIDPFNWILQYNPDWADKQILHVDFLNLGLGNLDLDEYMSILAQAIAEPVLDNRVKSFTRAALTIIEGVLHYTSLENKTLADFFDLLTDESLLKIGNRLDKYNATLDEPNRSIKKAIKQIKDCYTKGAVNEFGSGVSTYLSEGINFLGIDAIYNMVRQSNTDQVFDIMEYLKGDADIYLIIPPHMVERSAKFVKLFLGVLRSGFTYGSAYLKSEYYPIVLDEVAQLGYVKDIEVLYEVLRFEGAILKLFFQDLSQLKVFAQKEEMFKSFDVLQFFEVQGLANIEFIQRIAGRMTIENRSVSERDKTGFLEKDTNVSKSDQGTDFFTADKIRELDNGRQFLIFKNCPIIVCDRFTYFEDSRYKKHYAINYTRKELRGKVDKEQNLEIKNKVVNERKSLYVIDDEGIYHTSNGIHQDTKLKIDNNDLKSIEEVNIQSKVLNHIKSIYEQQQSNGTDEPFTEIDGFLCIDQSALNYIISSEFDDMSQILSDLIPTCLKELSIEDKHYYQCLIKLED
jgi:type IV secretory pathway TraG/TraD family ATPase VirD4